MKEEKRNIAEDEEVLDDEKMRDNGEMNDPEEPEKEENSEETEEKEKSPEELLEEKNEQLKDMTDKYMRALAEADNARKRAAKDRDDIVKFLKGEYVREFIPIMDNLERALNASKKTDDIKTIKDGVKMVLKQFEGVFSKMGVKEIKTKGVFDPMTHHVMHKEYQSGKKEGEITEVYQKGYEIDGTLIRPAMVKVAAKKESEPQ
ncbi:MAG: nucleotide exchange factor GrpE [Candidatus Goldiibacteriota bacterium]